MSTMWICLKQKKRKLNGLFTKIELWIHTVFSSSGIRLLTNFSVISSVFFCVGFHFSRSVFKATFEEMYDRLLFII